MSVVLPWPLPKRILPPRFGAALTVRLHIVEAAAAVMPMAVAWDMKCRRLILLF